MRPLIATEATEGRLRGKPAAEWSMGPNFTAWGTQCLLHLILYHQRLRGYHQLTDVTARPLLHEKVVALRGHLQYPKKLHISIFSGVRKAW